MLRTLERRSNLDPFVTHKFVGPAECKSSSSSNGAKRALFFFHARRTRTEQGNQTLFTKTERKKDWLVTLLFEFSLSAAAAATSSAECFAISRDRNL